MNLYYYPDHLEMLTSIPIPLYTDECVSLMNEQSRANLKPFTEKELELIGDRPCYFPKPRTEQEMKLVVACLAAEYGFTSDM